ncbi:MAG: bifunctional phosphoglucose/phosphomannose isomerase [Bacteroidetes bacterium]|nr:bifunctional phosphoglucose/phosphomannose isomerase [Bacteroidota bacterium]
MKQLVQAFPTQLQEALIIGQSYRFQTPQKEFKNIVLTGLGGSGIGGSIVQNYVSDKISIPFLVNKDYTLPAFVNEDTLVIASSYSGNTEETISAVNQALKAKATIVCITSGGKLSEIAKKKNLDCILLPAGMPPRACLGYSLTQVLYVLLHFGYIKPDFEKNIKATIKLLTEEEKEIQKQAKALAKKLIGRTPIIYSAGMFEAVGVRFRQQINENGKMLCWHHVIPEMNHNELVGWRTKDPSRVVIFLRNENDPERVQMRMEINKPVIKKYTPHVIELWSKGKSFFEQVFYIVHLTDWISVYLADLNGVDAMDIEVINNLKNALSKA